MPKGWQKKNQEVRQAGISPIWLILICFVAALFAGIPLQAYTAPQFKAEFSSMRFAKNICVMNDSVTMITTLLALQSGHVFGEVYNVKRIPLRGNDTKLSGGRWQCNRSGQAFSDTSRIVHINVAGWRIACVFNFQFKLSSPHSFPYALEINTRNRDIGALSVHHSVQLFLHRVMLLLHCLPLPTVDISLNHDGRKDGEAQRIHGEKLDALGHVGEEDANKEQNSEQSYQSDSNPPEISVRSVAVVLGGLAGIVIGFVMLWHGLDLLWGQNSQGSLTEKHQSANTEIVSPHGFIQIYRNEKDDIESAKVIPSPLGSRNFGRILIKWKHVIKQTKDRSKE